MLPVCFILFSFSKAWRYRVAVASETCSNFSTSSLVIFPLSESFAIILSSFLCFVSWILARAFAMSPCRAGTVGVELDCCGSGLLCCAGVGSGTGSDTSACAGVSVGGVSGAGATASGGGVGSVTGAETGSLGGACVSAGGVEDSSGMG